MSMGRRPSKERRTELRGVVGREALGRSAVRRSSSARMSFSDLVVVVVGLVPAGVGLESIPSKRASRTSAGLDMAGAWRRRRGSGRGGGGVRAEVLSLTTRALTTLKSCQEFRLSNGAVVLPHPHQTVPLSATPHLSNLHHH